MKRVVETAGDLVKKIRVGIHQTPSRKIRVVLDLDSGRRYEIEQHFFQKEKVYAIIVKTEKGP